jgi:hypothetical protein
MGHVARRPYPPGKSQIRTRNHRGLSLREQQGRCLQCQPSVLPRQSRREGSAARLLRRSGATAAKGPPANPGAQGGRESSDSEPGRRSPRSTASPRWQAPTGKTTPDQVTDNEQNNRRRSDGCRIGLPVRRENERPRESRHRQPEGDVLYRSPRRIAS